MNISTCTAGELMTPKVATIPASAPALGAIQQMRDLRLQALVVPPTTSRDGYGIVTVKDILGVLDLDAEDVLADLDELLVSDIMTKPVICTQESMGARDCIQLMRMTGVRRLLIARGTEIVGILSYTDIFAAIAPKG